MSKKSNSKKQFFALGILKNSFVFLLLGGMLIILIATFNTYRESYFVQINIEERDLELENPATPNIDNLNTPDQNQIKN